ncbi:uncharacterized protein [Watersipora subatra]|uniref:uncharacterized protein n=1 Tax=Watersipora subatra TaxID=2589382 RepID=UPI00355C7B91
MTHKLYLNVVDIRHSRLPACSESQEASETGANSSSKTVCMTIYFTVPLINGNTGSSHLPNVSLVQQINAKLISHGYATDLNKCVLRFKNQRGSHVPLNVTTVKGCSAHCPLLVEICEIISQRHVSEDGTFISRMPAERVAERAAIARNVCRRLNSRLRKLEEAIAKRPTPREIAMEQEVTKLAKRVDRLEGLLNQASQNEWEGTIQRKPFW